MKGKIFFNLYPFQEDTIRALQQHRYVVINKSRQMGISTLLAAYALLNMIFRPGYKVLVIATTQDVAANLVRKVKVMYSNLPTFMRSRPVESNNKLSLELSNGSFIKAVSSSKHSGRSEALSLLIIDEAAHLERFDDIWTSAQLTLATGGDCVILSTPNGVGNGFARIFMGAEQGKIEDELEIKFHPISLPWYLHPDRDQKWRDTQTSLLGKRAAAQECDCDFLGSGATVVEPEVLAYYKDLVETPVQVRGMYEDLWIWKFPDYSKSYMTIVDTARGDGADGCAIEVFEIETMEQVAEYEGKIPPSELARLACAVSTEWNTALLIIENTGIGYATCQAAIDLKYPNLHYSYKNDPFMDDKIQLAKGYDLKDIKDKTPGFTNSHAVRPVIISKIETYCREKFPKLKSKRLNNQLYTLVWKGSRAEAEKGFHDDLAMAFGIGLFLRDTAIRLKQIGVEITKKTLENTHKVIHKPVITQQDPWKIKNSRGQEVDLRWLLS